MNNRMPRIPGTTRELVCREKIEISSSVATINAANENSPVVIQAPNRLDAVLGPASAAATIKINNAKG